MWETWVQSLAWEEALEQEIATHSSILAWRIPWTEDPGGLQSIGSQSEVDMSEVTEQAHDFEIWNESICGDGLEKLQSSVPSEPSGLLEVVHAPCSNLVIF